MDIALEKDLLQRCRNVPDYHAQSGEKATRRRNVINDPFRVDRSQGRTKPRQNDIDCIGGSWQLIDLSDGLPFFFEP